MLKNCKMNTETRTRRFVGPMIAYTALFGALGGTAVALPGRNTVDSNDLRNGAVTTRALRNGAVTTEKLGANSVTSASIGLNSVTGDDVDESTLGPVPSANSANNVSFLRPINVRMAFGEDVELVANGEVSLRARCVLNGTVNGNANSDGVEVYARTTAVGSFLEGSDDRIGDNNGNGLQDNEALDPGDAIDDSTFAVIGLKGGGPAEQSVENDIDEGFVVAPDGSYIGVDSESLLLAIRALGSDCAVIGLAHVQG